MNGRGECTGVGFTCHHRVAGFECDSSTPELCPYFKNTGTVTDGREGARHLMLGIDEEYKESARETNDLSFG